MSQNVQKATISANVVFLCHDGEGHFLLSKRGENTRDNHNLWDPGSGRVEFGETSMQALTRELEEEYGVQPIEQALLGVRENVDTYSHWITFEYLVKVDRSKVKNNEPHKLDELRWFNVSELPLEKSHPLFSFLVTDHYTTLQNCGM